MQLITLTEIANLHNAVLFPYQVEELSCNKHIVEVDCIGKAYNNWNIFQIVMNLTKKIATLKNSF